MKSAYPNYTEGKVVSSLRTGPKITDPKSGIMTPRVDLTEFLPRRFVRNDFEADGTSDLVWRQVSTGATYGSLMIERAFSGSRLRAGAAPPES